MVTAILADKSFKDLEYFGLGGFIALAVQRKVARVRKTFLLLMLDML